MSDLGWVSYAQDFVEDSLASQEGWADIVVDLRGEGLDEEVITTVLREHQAWAEEAREWKQHGYPYDEIVRRLRDDLAGTWGDVAQALLTIGLTPSDMLRVVLPLLGEDTPLRVFQVAFIEEMEEFEQDEAWEVADYYFPGVHKEESFENHRE